MQKLFKALSLAFLLFYLSQKVKKSCSKQVFFKLEFPLLFSLIIKIDVITQKFKPKYYIPSFFLQHTGMVGCLVMAIRGHNNSIYMAKNRLEFQLGLLNDIFIFLFQFIIEKLRVLRFFSELFPNNEHIFEVRAF